jgi:hypothetical protein
VQPGTRLGPSEILLPLGAGGMGEVWRARDTRPGREVAMRCCRRNPRWTASPVARFHQEGPEAPRSPVGGCRGLLGRAS